MSVEDEMREILLHALKPTRLNIKNVSERHKDHASSPGGADTHFEIEIESEAFRGMSRLACHKLVYHHLRYIMTTIHALSVKASAA